MYDIVFFYYLFLLFQCCEMLELLGVPFIQAASEAEAMCAFLNRHHVGHNSSILFQFGGLQVWV